ncbi:MAG: IclR family transcriptional regulator [Hyphomicrobiaceae bacterium]|nr:IclR family transcriptional regulator [Hyphomicrobiaceae bacterium]
MSCSIHALVPSANMMDTLVMKKVQEIATDRPAKHDVSKDSLVRPKRDKTLRKGLHILELLTVKGAMNLRDVASLSGLTKGNAHQLLQTLIEEGYVQQDDATSQYDATLKLWEVGTQHYERLDLVGPCLAGMEYLSNATRETVILAMLDGHEVLYLHKIDSLEPVRSYTRVGAKAPAYCVATGKALIAFDPRGEAFWRSISMEAFSDTTIVDTETFVNEMKETRQRGWSINRGEWRGAVWGVAAPIVGWCGRVRLAIGISGPSNRFTPDNINGLGPMVVAAADDAAVTFGGGAGKYEVGRARA